MNPFRARRLSDRSTGATTFIAEGCTIEGNLAGEGDYLICGEVRGDCKLMGTVTIAGSGKWRGNLTAEHVVVAGEIEGDTTAKGRIEVRASARIKGAVVGSEIAVAQGAVIVGELKTVQDRDPVEFIEQRANAAESDAA